MNELDEVRKEPSLMADNDIDPEMIYRWVSLSAGADFRPQVSDAACLKRLIEEKKQKGIH